MRGRLDAKALESSLAAILRRHEALRTTFVEKDGQAEQAISPPEPFALKTVDVQGAAGEEREANARRLAEDEAKGAFDLTRGPLYRFTLLRLEEEEHTLLAVFHHIVFDGWSVGVFLDEMAELYVCCSEGRPSPVPELPIQYADYAFWNRERGTREDMGKELVYWRERLASPPPPLDLPADHARPPAQTFRGALEEGLVDAETFRVARALSLREGTTLFAVLLAGWSALLSRYAGQDDIVVGAGLAGRNRPELEGLIGFFVNTLPLRMRLSGNPTFRELLSRVTEAVLGAHEHQEAPFERIVAELHAEREMSRTPLFQVMFAFDNTRKPAQAIRGLDIRVEEIDNGTAKFDLTLAAQEDAEGVRLALEYNTDLFERSTAARMMEHFTRLLGDAVSRPERRLSELSLLSDGERHQIVVEWNRTATDYPRTATIHEVFEAQVRETPDAVAVEFRGEPLSYGELNGRANQLAHYLRSLGVGAEARVGVCMERSAELVVAVCGILKAGGAYVPLEASFPGERLSFMIEEADVSLVLTEERLLERLPETGQRVVVLEREAGTIAREPMDKLANGVAWPSLAYVMYTSGSTGMPKGVAISHRNVVRLVKNTNYARLGAEEVFLFMSNFSFDASTFELWGSLLNGGKLVVYPSELPSLEELGEAIARNRVTTLFLTAGLFHQMVENQLDSLRGVRQLMAGGEVLSPPHVRQIVEALPGCTFSNVYGPTEGATFTSAYRVVNAEEIRGTVPIGRPIANTRVYVLDVGGNPAPVGVHGELYIGGDGVAAGYLNRPELTAERFVPDPFSDEDGARLYKTGDIVRWLESGVIDFVGRRDGQVKLRGFRVEMGEIETVLNTHPAVRESVVMVREDRPGDKRLAAYVARAPGMELDTNELRAFLRERLPEYMAPGAFVVLEALPLTANGKVDRRALPAPEGTGGAKSGLAAPRTPCEEVLAGIWRHLLGAEAVSIHDSFFDIGGHSLLAIQMVARIRERMGVAIAVREVFQAPTIETLAERIVFLKAARVETSSSVGNGVNAGTGGTCEPSQDPCIVTIRREGSKLPLFCIEGSGSAAGAYGSLVTCLRADRPVYGVQNTHLELEKMAAWSVEQLATLYLRAIRAVQASGPYYLAGWSFGGTLAFEMAQRLTREGERVAFLGMMESYPAVWPKTAMGRFVFAVRRIPDRVRSRWVMAYYTMPIIRGHLRNGVRMMLSRIVRGKSAPSAAASLKEYVAYFRQDIVRQYFQIQAGLEPVEPNGDRIATLDDPYVRRITQRIAENIRAMHEYSMQPYPGRIVFFRAEHDPWHSSHRDGTMGWKKIAMGGVDVSVIPGNHMVLMKRPFVETFAGEFQRRLDQV